MRWRKLGRVFEARQGPSWMNSHAAYPTPLLIGPEQLRVFFCCRDGDNRGSVAWVDVDPVDPLRVLAVSQYPSLTAGETGAFDDRGVSIGSICRHDGGVWLYYLGWNKSVDVPFRNSIGLACSSDAQTFHRRFRGPVLDRSRFDPFTLSYPFVVPGDAQQPWQMIYGSSQNGGTDETLMQHTLTTATSCDGLNWRATGEVIVSLENGEYGLSRPWVREAADGPVLFYSIRREQYAIGASKYDKRLQRWKRISNNVLGSPCGDWDSQATCYPSTITVGEQTYMFFCGNGYGRTGFGVAILA